MYWRYRLEKNTQHVKDMQLKLEDKCSEFDQLATVLHRTRSDMSQKISRQQKDFDEKISFLLQQLRDTEVKLHENSNMLRNSLESQSSKANISVSGTNSNVGGAMDMFIRPKTGPARTSMTISVKSMNDGLRSSKEDEEQNVEDNEELMRKWSAEKQRREQLEKRNGELIREIRVLRSHK